MKIVYLQIGFYLNIFTINIMVDYLDISSNDFKNVVFVQNKSIQHNAAMTEPCPWYLNSSIYKKVASHNVLFVLHDIDKLIYSPIPNHV